MNADTRITSVFMTHVCHRSQKCFTTFLNKRVGNFGLNDYLFYDILYDRKY